MSILRLGLIALALSVVGLAAESVATQLAARETTGFGPKAGRSTESLEWSSTGCSSRVSSASYNTPIPLVLAVPDVRVRGCEPLGGLLLCNKG